MILRRKLGDLDPRAIMTGSLLVAAVALTPFALLGLPGGGIGGDAWASIVVLGVLCTALAFVLFGSLVLEVGVSRASVITYVAPVVALGAGVVVLGESPGPGALVGLLLIIAGSWLSTGGGLPPGLGSRRRSDAAVGMAGPGGAGPEAAAQPGSRSGTQRPTWARIVSRTQRRSSGVAIR